MRRKTLFASKVASLNDILSGIQPVNAFRSILWNKQVNRLLQKEEKIKGKKRAYRIRSGKVIPTHYFHVCFLQKRNPEFIFVDRMWTKQIIIIVNWKIVIYYHLTNKLKSWIKLAYFCWHYCFLIVTMITYFAI